VSNSQFGGGLPLDDEPRSNFSKFIAVGIFAAVIALGATLASNIVINTGGPIEFGQGLTQTVACSGNTQLKITPQASFANASGSGSFYFKSVTVSNIPVGCQGYDFTINAYDNSNASPLQLFAATEKNLIVYDSSTGFVVGGGLTGFTLTSGSDSFTATFTNPVALTSDVYKLTIQTGFHAIAASEQCAANGTRTSGGPCRVGDIGSGGGIIFYASAAAFTAQQSLCGSSCHYLEFAPKGWAPISPWATNYSYNGQVVSNRTDPNIDPFLVWSDANVFNNVAPGALSTGTAIGTGYLNTRQIESNTVTTGKPYRFAFTAALSYAGNSGSSTAGQWFIPSNSELNELCKYVRGQTNDLGNTSIQCVYPPNPPSALGFGDWNSPYWSSTYGFSGATGQSWGYYFGYLASNPLLNGYYSSYGGPVRPIRVS
jgi:hypothetical protein